MGKKNKTSSVHTWIGTIGGIITIIVWLTSIKTYFDNVSLKIGNLTIVSWDTPSLGITVALLLLTNGFVWCFYYLIVTSILTKMRNNTLMSIPTKALVWIIGFSIGIIILDVFFNIRSLIYGASSTDLNNASNSIMVLGFFGILIGLALPIYTINTANKVSLERGCVNCGRIALIDMETRDTDISEEHSHIKNDDGSTVLQLWRYQNYELDRQCKHCKSVWTFYRRYLIDIIEYPEEDTKTTEV